jgi:hypothetical protein
MVVDWPTHMALSGPALATGTGRTLKEVVAVLGPHSLLMVRVMLCGPIDEKVTVGLGEFEDVGVPVGKLQL